MSTVINKDDLARARQLFKARLERQFQQYEIRRLQTLEMVLAVGPTIIAKYPNVTTAYLFGSLLRPGSFQVTSDIDIAVLGIEPQFYASLWHELEIALPDWFIDLREMPADSSFTTIVKLTGKKIYARTDTPFTSRN